MWKAGYATFIWDKPGYGKSTGKFDEKQLLHQRAKILIHAIEAIKKEPLIDHRRIGLWGISQGGYVMSIMFLCIHHRPAVSRNGNQEQQRRDGATILLFTSTPWKTGSLQLRGHVIKCHLWLANAHKIQKIINF